MCAALSPLQICPFSGGKFRFSPSPIPCFNSLPVQALLGLLFSFSAYPPVFLSHLSEWRRNQFSLTWGLAAAPGFTHNWLTRLQRGREPVPLVSFPYPVPKTAQRAAQGRVLVFSPERAYPSPFRGRGEVSPVWFAGFFTQRSPVLFRRKRRILRIRGLLLAVALATAAHNWLTWLQRGRFRALVVSFPYPSSKPHTGPHRAEFGFTALFSRIFSSVILPAGAPGGNLPLRGWAGSCKAVSRFLRFRPKSTRWSAGFR